MLTPIFKREFLQELKNPAFYLLFLVLVLLTIQDSSNDVPTRTIINYFGQSWHNAPIFVAKTTAMLSLLTLLFPIYLVGRSVFKDFENNVHAFYFTSPISKTEYLFGRFLGSTSATLLAFTGIFLGVIIGCSLIESKFSGPHSFQAYLFAYSIIALPCVLFISSLFFSLATLTRKMFMTYIAGVGFLIIFGFVSSAISEYENELFRILIDPTGLSYLNHVTQDWTVSEINSNLVPIQFSFILNRILWLSVSAGILFFTWRKFSLTASLEQKEKKILKTKDLAVTTKSSTAPSITNLSFEYSANIQLKQLFHLVWRDAKRILKHPAFLVLTLLSIHTTFGNFTANVGPNGSNVYAVTSWFIDNIDTAWGFIMPITIFFAGMLVWKERDHNSYEFYDTLPNPSWMSYTSKLLVLTSIQVSYVLGLFICGILSQIILFDYTDINLALYFQGLVGIELINYWHIAVMVLFIQILAGNKYLGFFLSALYYVIDIVVFQVNGWGLDILQYGHLPAYTYSMINGFGHYAEMLTWFRVYWIFPAFILVLLSILFYPRGPVSTFRNRLKLAKQRLNTQFSYALISLIFLTILTGSFIYYNNHVLNDYITEDTAIQKRADYEKKYGSYEFLAQPSVEDVQLEIDLFPYQRSSYVKGQYSLTNNTNEYIDKVLVNLTDSYISKINSLIIERAAIIKADNNTGVFIFEFDNPLGPGEKTSLQFDHKIDINGFSTTNPKSAITENGSFIYSFPFAPADFLPSIGFNNLIEINSNDIREEYGLPEEEMPSLNNKKYVQQEPSDLVTYNAVISTSPDQKAISNGKLVKEWGENNRRYYHYKSDEKINFAIGITSGRFEVATKEHNGITLNVFYDLDHSYNIDRMMKGMIAGFEYCESNFGSYPYKSLKITEVSAASYPGNGNALSIPTIFAWQENGGFISNLEDPNAFDAVFSTTTHELAHQWWAHMVRAAWVEGVGVLTETIAQWVRVMAIEKEYGSSDVKKYLADQMYYYLSQRKTDYEGEVPLMKAQNQTYLIYNKGAVAMYALKEYIGENNVNRALRNIVNEYGLKSTEQYPTTETLVNELRKVTPDSLQYLVTDLFEKIVLYQLQAVNAESSKTVDGYSTTIQLTVQKVKSNSIGEETEIEMSDYIPIGVFNSDEKLIHYSFYKLDSGTNSVTIHTADEPAQISLDPDNILIERDRSDNAINVESPL